MLARFLEFFIVGLALGVVEDLIAISLATDKEIDLQVFVVAFLVAFNTVRLAIYSSKEEITVMKLVGATNWFVRGPFIVETMLYGLISATVSVVLLNGLFAAASSTLQASSLGLLDINYSYQYFSNHFWLFLTVQIGIGILIGAVSSLIATRRYLKFTPSKK